MKDEVQLIKEQIDAGKRAKNQNPDIQVKQAAVLSKQSDALRSNIDVVNDMLEQIEDKDLLDDHKDLFN